MTPAARLAAAIEVLDQIEVRRAAAEDVLKAWGRAHRFAGSKDRREIAEWVYRAIRLRAKAGIVFGTDDGRAQVLCALAVGENASVDDMAALFSGEGYAPPALTEVERSAISSVGEVRFDPRIEAGCPEWIAARLERQWGEDWLEEARAAILPRAPVDLRVNRLRGDVEGALRLLNHDEVRPARTPLSALGLRLPADQSRDVHTLRAYSGGWVEVQDEGSQIVAALAGARPGDAVIDYCAGGGGKTLALAAAMGGRGRIIACDVSAKRLSGLPERLGRAGVQAEIRTLSEGGEGVDDLTASADLVLVDAPCSGSGTWRRKPEGVWRLNTEAIERLHELQSTILDRAARLVRPGGRLVYVTCSLFAEENEATVARFAAKCPAFSPRPLSPALSTADITEEGRERLAALCRQGHTLQLTPHRAGTDGFFIAQFERTA